MMRRVLIIEDDAQWAQILCAILALQGWKPAVVGTMARAWEFLRFNLVEATLLDLRLPDSDIQSSLDAITTLKSLGSGPVIVVTGAPMDDHLLLVARWSGAAQVVSKDVRAFSEKLIAAFESPIHA